MDARLHLETHQNFQKMKKEKSQITEKILSLVLDILYLLIEEDYIIVKESGNHVKYSNTAQRAIEEPLSQSTGSNNKKILEVTSKIIELLTGEEWDCLQEHNDLEKEPDTVKILKKNQQALVQAMLSNSRSKPKPFLHSSIPAYIRKDRGIITVSPHDTSFELLQNDSNPTVITASTPPLEDVKLPEIYIHIPTDQIDYVPVSNNRTPSIPENFSSRNICKPVVCDVETATSAFVNKQMKTDVLVVKIKEESTDWEEGEFGMHMKQEKRQHLPLVSKSNPVSYMDSVIGADHILEPYTSAHIKQEADAHMEGHVLHPGMASPSHHSQLEQNSDLQTGRKFQGTNNFLVRGNAQVHYMSSLKNDPRDRVTYHDEESNDALSPISLQRKHVEEISYKYYLPHSGSAQPEADDPVKPFSCSECGRCFKYRKILLYHAKSHQKKPLICCECGKQYLCKLEFDIHMRIHTGEKPFVCSECGKGFRRKSHMLRHQKIHREKRLFPCPECTKCFNRLNVLNQHRKIHRANLPSSDMENVHARTLWMTPTNSLDKLQAQAIRGL